MTLAKTSVSITVRRWFQKTYGNTYFSANALVDGKPVEGIDFEYGYGSHGEYQMMEKLIEDGYVAKPLHGAKTGNAFGIPSLYTQNLGLNYHCETIDVSRKRDL